jgi:glycine betaine/proline transport system permease protein
MLDRLSKAWVVKQPKHFERGTSWFRQHMTLVVGMAAFIGFIILAQFIPIFESIGRKQDLSVGKELDLAIKAFLNIDSIQAVTDWLRWFLNVWVLIPFRDWLLWLPTPTIILAIAALGYLVGGRRTSILVGSFFFIVALTGWWDRAIITLYTVASAVVISAMIGIPLGIWAARGAAQPMTSNSTPKELLIGTIGLIFKRMPIVTIAAIAAGMLHFFNGSERAFLSPMSLSFWLFAAVLFGLWLLVRRWSRDQVVLIIADTAQTFPSFIYLIPAIMLFGVNDVAVVFSIVIFATVPLTRYTIEGLRAVPPELAEAADMSGATRSQKLWNVQLPLALPTMAIGFNQAIMFAFFMVIIAAFIGTQDLGQELQRTLAGGDLGKNIVLGICVSLMALAFDHMIMRWATDRKIALGVG